MGESRCPVINMSLVTLRVLANLPVESVIVMKSCREDSSCCRSLYQLNLWKYAPKYIKSSEFLKISSGLMHHDLIKSVEHRNSCCVHLRSMERFYCRRHGRKGPWMDKGKQTWMKLRYLQCKMTYIWQNDSHLSYYIYMYTYIPYCICM